MAMSRWRAATTGRWLGTESPSRRMRIPKTRTRPILVGRPCSCTPYPDEPLGLECRGPGPRERGCLWSLVVYAAGSTSRLASFLGAGDSFGIPTLDEASWLLVDAQGTSPPIPSPVLVRNASRSPRHEARRGSVLPCEPADLADALPWTNPLLARSPTPWLPSILVSSHGPAYATIRLVVPRWSASQGLSTLSPRLDHASIPQTAPEELEELPGG